MSSTSSGPAFAFNPLLHHRTIDPPVQIGAQWARSYPGTSSPFAAKSALDAHPLLNLAQGVPGQAPTKDFLDHIANETNAEYSHGYGPVFGHAAIRKAVADDLNRVYRSADLPGHRNQVQPHDVAITAGCNLAFAATVLSLAAPGEAVVVPTPWYFNHFMTLSSFGIDTVPLPTAQPDFLPSTDALKQLLRDNPKIKAVILVTPNNPTGALYPPALIHDFARTCRDAKIALLLDETYRDFVLAEDEARPEIGSSSGAKGTALAEGSPSTSLPLGRPHEVFQESMDGDSAWNWRQTVIQLFSFSKSYAIPGHRLGGVVAHPAFLQQVTPSATGGEDVAFGPMAKALDNLQIGPPRTDTQRAVAWAMADEKQREWRLSTARELRDRRVAFKQGLSRKVPRRLDSDGNLLSTSSSSSSSSSSDGAKSPEEWGWAVESSGAYYAFVRHPFTSTPSEKVSEALAKLVGVVTLPGTFFMPPGSPASQHEAKKGEAGAGAITDSGARLRVSIANVPTDKLDLLPERLAVLSELWQIKGEGWGV
ncbi:uncharacterized protein PFL1_03725 [Pseudozyma flocculosa PF-1]|uniref:Aminotransferase class I/classII large domain-containing protein n=1 Tax=Pseudozyma flocculosa PF-1 TaxID=1277687 RepID=A0A061HA74_9BASI|nr:uncharacterized protein PFL1_03725 [Pseudozyma flocculosa PF-1]EPQ28925.1 hypothetical protein PFL1_03725 [Pseudozyma flocculosa PF-1]